MTTKFEEALTALNKLTDDDLSALKFVMPWQVYAGETESDPDGFVDKVDGTKKTTADQPSRQVLQQECWNKAHLNPQVNTAIRGQVGRVTGYGFDVSSDIPKIQEVLEDLWYDPRNRLFDNMTKYVARSIIEGELFLCITVHVGGFLEVDFIDPSAIAGGGEDGIIYHPTKQSMPLFYYTGDSESVVPSINIAYFPSIFQELIKSKERGKGDTYKGLSSKTSFKKSMSTTNFFNKLFGFNRFMVTWDKSFLSKRNVSHLRTVLEWLNHYENLKQYEIDHKKSAGAYLWTVSMEDAKTFRVWLSLTDEERRKTGIMAKKSPGNTLVLPPGMKLEVVNPDLPSISETDTDILHMVTAGLNEPEDVSTGQAKGTFASVKASRGPMSDRISDEIAYFERWLRHDFFRAIFFLKSFWFGFPEKFKVKEAVDFKNQEPVFKEVEKRPEFLLEVTFPTSEVIDAESRARAYLGVKHASLYDTVGIPHAEVAKRLGFGNFRRLRLQHATEKDKYPDLLPSFDAEALQENQNVKGSGAEGGTGTKAKKKLVKRKSDDKE